VIAGCSKGMSVSTRPCREAPRRFVFRLHPPTREAPRRFVPRLHPPTREAPRRFVPRAAAASTTTRRISCAYVEPLSETRRTPGEKRVSGSRLRSNRRAGWVKSIGLGWAREDSRLFNSLQGWDG
jgi:hypothetical protein